MATTYYSGYGLTIQSDLQLPELQSADEGTADVKIQFGSVPADLPDAAKGVAWQAVPGQLLLNVQDVARYWVTNGDTITIDPYGDCDQEEDFRAFLFGSVWGALLHQRGFLTLHASAIATPNGAVLFAGNSGAGKSTLATAMEQKGYALLSDDKTAIVFDPQQRPMAIPAYPTRRLWLDSVRHLHQPIEKMQRLRANLNKYVSRIENFYTEAQPVHTVYILHSHNRPAIEHEPCKGIEGLTALIDCAYRKKMLYGLGGRQSQFQMTSALTKAVRVVNLYRPVTPFMLDELVALIQEKIKQEQIS
ncbi:MAG: hypothetical protein WA885_14500 [Phormidesmis sp.]